MNEEKEQAMSYGEFGSRRSRANVAVAAACLFLTSCAAPFEDTMHSLALAPSC